MKEEDHLAEREDMARRWGSIELAQEWVAREAPSLAHDAEYVEWFAKSMRHGASPGSAAAFEDMYYAIDVRSILGSVQAPTLVLAIPGADEQFETVGAGQERDVADRIPGAKYVELPGRDLVIIATNPALLLDEIRRFINSVSAEEAEFDRVLATVLFTDIVGSTERAVDAGRRGVEGPARAASRGGPGDDRALPRHGDRHGRRRVLRDVRRPGARRAVRAGDRRGRAAPRPRDPRRPAHRRDRDDRR